MTTHLPVTSSDVRETYADAGDFGSGTSANYANRAHAFDEWLETTIAAARARGFAEGKAAGDSEKSASEKSETSEEREEFEGWLATELAKRNTPTEEEALAIINKILTI